MGHVIRNHFTKTNYMKVTICNVNIYFLKNNLDLHRALYSHESYEIIFDLCPYLINFLKYFNLIIKKLAIAYAC